MTNNDDMKIMYVDIHIVVHEIAGLKLLPALLCAVSPIRKRGTEEMKSFINLKHLMRIVVRVAGSRVAAIGMLYSCGCFAAKYKISIIKKQYNQKFAL